MRGKQRKMTDKHISKYLSDFKKGNKKNKGLLPNERYSSFDYCFNYFQGFSNKKDIAKRKNIELSCLHLGFYLASWGMLRGSSFLLQKSLKHYVPLLKWIAKQDNEVWHIDVNNYSEENYKILDQLYNGIVEKLQIKKHTRILTTKILLGVFGCTPALDSYFVKSLKGTSGKFSTALKKIKDFYDTHNTIICNKQLSFYCYNFKTGNKSKKIYPKSKIIDMIHFSRGYKWSK